MAWRVHVVRACLHAHFPKACGSNVAEEERAIRASVSSCVAKPDHLGAEVRGTPELGRGGRWHHACAFGRDLRLSEVF